VTKTDLQKIFDQALRRTEQRVRQLKRSGSEDYETEKEILDRMVYAQGQILGCDRRQALSNRG
jgi:hypothetical protein